VKADSGPLLPDIRICYTDVTEPQASSSAPRGSTNRRHWWAAWTANHCDHDPVL